MYVSNNIFGLVLVLDHDDTDRFVVALGGGVAAVGPLVSAALAAAAVAVPIITLVVAALVAWGAVSIALIKAVDRGYGVYITIPWPILFSGGIMGFIPTTRPDIGLGKGWGNIDHGEFHTEDSADRIRYRIEHGAVSTDVVEFMLAIGNDSSGWAKSINMPDGEGNSWDIMAEGRQNSAVNGIWAPQVKNGQSLTFSKPKEFGRWYAVLTQGYLEDLKAGDRVVFTWERD